MGSAAGIPGLTKGPDFENEKKESAHLQNVRKEVKQNQVSQTNDPIILSAVEKLEQLSSLSSRKIDIQYDNEKGVVVFTIYSPDGQNKIWQIPKDDAIKMAFKMSNSNSQYINAIM